MARSPAPPGPPPAHFRPPATPPAPGVPIDYRPLETPPPKPPSPPPGTSGVVVAAVAVGMLLVGVVFGFFIGRAVDDEPTQQAATTTTTTTVAPGTGGTIPQETPTSAPDPNAPPSTDLEPTVIGTLEDPIPVGEPYILGVFEVTVTGADLDAADRLADHDADNPEPEPGDRRVLVEIVVRFVDSVGVADTSYLPFDLSDGSSVWTDLDAGCGNVPDSMLDGFFLGPGDEATGNVCFTVPATVTGTPDGLYLTTEGFDGPVYFAISE